jgi:hypothetical protein
MTRRVLPLLLVLAVAAAAAVLVLGHGSDGATKASGQAQGTPRPPAKPPVVMIAFDEFPVDVLRDPDGQIDSLRFPNFAALARMSTWFVNGQSSHDSTPHALPAIMDGRKPTRDAPANAKGHPTSVFTLFAGRGYRVVASEEATDVCPPRVCPGAAKRRKGALSNIRSGREQRLERWISKIHRRARPTFYFKHALIPHIPWVYLPSGKHMKVTLPSLASPKGFDDPDLTKHNEERLLLQTGFADRELGHVLAHLRRARMLRDAMIVVTADHGNSFDLHVKDRRTVTHQNIDQIATVPMFVKAPGQTQGRVDLAIAHNTDLVPTMAGLLHIHVPWRTAGRSAFSAATRRRRQIVMPKRYFNGTIRIGLAEMLRRRATNIDRWSRAFGTGLSDSLLIRSPWESVYSAGSHPQLVGRPLSSLRVSRPGRTRATIAGHGLWRHVNPTSKAVPVQVAGWVLGNRGGVKRAVAVAVNGRIQATSRTFTLKGIPLETFSLIVPESSLRRGRNLVDVLAVGHGRSPRLTLLARA